MPKSIPTISSIPELQQWRQAVKSSLVKIPVPKIPWNFSVVSKQGGNYLSWQVVKGADGYIVDVSPTGDFSSATVFSSVKLRGNQNITYFHTVPTVQGAAPVKQFYRVRATSGSTQQPQAVEGLNSGVISSTAIAPNDTTTASSTGRDNATTDKTQAQTSSRYKTY